MNNLKETLSTLHHLAFDFSFTCCSSKGILKNETPFLCIDFCIPIYLFLSTLILVFPQVVLSQDYTIEVEHFSVDHGISHRDVQSIIQDDQGFMWFGTKYGLNRFDGKEFDWFTKEKDGLQANEIKNMLKDKEGNLWLFHTTSFFLKTTFSIDIFNPLTNEVQSFKEKFGKEAPFLMQNVRSFAQNKAGVLVFITKDSELFFYDRSFRKVQINIPAIKLIHNVEYSPTGLVWMSFIPDMGPNAETNVKIMAFDENGKEILHFDNPDDGFALIYDLNEKGECRYISSNSKPDDLSYHYIDAQGNRYRDRLLEKKFRENSIHKDGFSPLNYLKKHDDLIWVANGQNWNRTDPLLKVLDVKGAASINNLDLLNDISHITDIYFSGKEKIWIATQFGIYKVELKNNFFSKILYNQDGRQPPIRSMLVDNQQKLWVVEEALANIWMHDLETNETRKLNQLDQGIINVHIGNSFVCAIKTKNGNIVLVSSGRLVEFNPQNYESQEYLIDEIYDNFGFIWNIHEDEGGKYWYTTDVGDVGVFENGKTSWYNIRDSLQRPSHIYQFHEDKKGQMWLVTDGGLFIWDMSNRQVVERYWSGGSNGHYFPFDNIHHLHEDSDGSFWLGTSGTGLIKWEPGTKNWQQFNKASGLSNNTIYAVYEDDYGKLWLSSDYGLMRFDKNNHQVQSYLVENGITHNEFNRISHYQAENGRLFFGGLNGVTSLNPEDFQSDTTAQYAPLVITDYQHYDKEGNLLADKKRDLIKESQIVIQPDDRFFRLEFALLTYSDVDKNQYAYKVEGVDKEWNYQKENTIRFSRLPYGNHVLKIKGQAANGQWSEEELAIKVNVLKPFYLQNWFIILAALLIFIGSYLFYKWRTSTLKRQKAELEEEVAKRTETIRQQAEELKSLEQLKSRFFANVSHELRTPLTLLLGPVNSLLKNKAPGNKDLPLLNIIKRNGNQLLKLINEILDLSKLESGKLELKEEPTDFNEFIQNILAQFYSFSQSVDVKLFLNYKVQLRLYLLIDRNKVEKILQNYLSNALKHTPADGSVELTIEETENEIHLKVSDSGEGIHPDDLEYIFDRFYQAKKSKSAPKGGTGIGLSLCKELAELLGGKVWAESTLGKGSTFYFHFPKKVTKRKIKTVVQEEKEESYLLEPVTTSAVPIADSLTDTSAKGKSQSILVVEDNPDLRQYITYLLADFNVITAENGQVALNILNDQKSGFKPDLIISDLMMPVMNGFEFLESIKSDDRWRHIPALMLTAKVNVKAKINALRIGVDDYLTKPFVEEELKARIEALLRNYKERLDLFSNVKEEAKSKKDSKSNNGPITSQVDLIWLKEVEEIFSKNLSNTNFNLDYASQLLHLSARQLQRRIKQHTGLTGHQYLLELRLSKTKDLLQEGKYATIKEVAYAVGFKDSKHFASQFKKRFGVNPSEYVS